MKIDKYISLSIEQTENFGFELAKKIKSNSFIALYGDLGAGKTAFIRGFISYFGKDTIVTSPTYNIVNTYSFKNATVYHFDMYRITDEDDLYSVGFYDYIENGIILTEWSENVSFAIPDDAIKIRINKLSNDYQREIIMEFPEC